MIFWINITTWRGRCRGERTTNWRPHKKSRSHWKKYYLSIMWIKPYILLTISCTFHSDRFVNISKKRSNPNVRTNDIEALLKIMSYYESFNFFDFRLSFLIEITDIVIDSTIEVNYILKHVLWVLLYQLTIILGRFDWNVTWRTHVKIRWVISIFDNIIFDLHIIIFLLLRLLFYNLLTILVIF